MSVETMVAMMDVTTADMKVASMAEMKAEEWAATMVVEMVVRRDVTTADMKVVEKGI